MGLLFSLGCLVWARPLATGCSGDNVMDVFQSILQDVTLGLQLSGGLAETGSVV